MGEVSRWQDHGWLVHCKKRERAFVYVSYNPLDTRHSLNHICSVSRNKTKKRLFFRFYTVGHETKQGSKVWNRKLEVLFHLRTHRRASTANTRRRPLCLMNVMQPVTLDRLVVLGNSFSRMCPSSLCSECSCKWKDKQNQNRVGTDAQKVWMQCPPWFPHYSALWDPGEPGQQRTRSTEGQILEDHSPDMAIFQFPCGSCRTNRSLTVYIKLKVLFRRGIWWKNPGQLCSHSSVSVKNNKGLCFNRHVLPPKPVSYGTPHCAPVFSRQ